MAQGPSLLLKRVHEQHVTMCGVSLFKFIFTFKGVGSAAPPSRGGRQHCQKIEEAQHEHPKGSEGVEAPPLQRRTGAEHSTTQKEKQHHTKQGCECNTAQSSTAKMVRRETAAPPRRRRPNHHSSFFFTFLLLTFFYFFYSLYIIFLTLVFVFQFFHF